MTRFRVALDARRLNGQRRGIGRYVHELAKHLPAQAPDIEFLLFVDRPLEAESIPAGCREILVGRPFTTDSQSVSGLWPKVRSYHWMNYLVPRVLDREHADLFHATNLAFPARARCPSVVTVHDLIYARAPGAFEPLYERYMKLAVPSAVRRARHVITDSNTTRDDMVRLVGADSSRISVVHLGVGHEYRVATDMVELEQAREQLRLPRRFVLHVGAIERRKKLDTLLAAAAPLLRANLVDEIVLAGEEGHGAGDVRRAAVELGISESVRYLNYVAQELLPSLYGLADVLSFAPVYEGFGMPVLEAMACGTPVVTSSVSSLPEVAGDAALMVSPGDVEGLREALSRVLTDTQLRDDLRQRGLARARKFSWESTAAGHLAVYRRVLETTGS